MVVYVFALVTLTELRLETSQSCRHRYQFVQLGEFLCSDLIDVYFTSRVNE